MPGKESEDLSGPGRSGGIPDSYATIYILVCVCPPYFSVPVRISIFHQYPFVILTLFDFIDRKLCIDSAVMTLNEGTEVGGNVTQYDDTQDDDDNDRKKRGGGGGER